MVGEEAMKSYGTLVYLAGSASAEFFADIALSPFEAVKVAVQTRPGFAKVCARVCVWGGSRGSFCVCEMGGGCAALPFAPLPLSKAKTHARPHARHPPKHPPPNRA